MTELVLAAVAAAVGLGAFSVVRVLGAKRRDAQILGLLATFGPAAERARSDPRVLVAWHPVAAAARRAFPEAFAALEADGQARFPFDAADVEAAHARCSTEWLDWEKRQDAEHRARRLAVEAELGSAADAAAPSLRARLEALEREKIERYQRRYEEYVSLSRALKQLSEERPPSANRGRSSPPAP